MPKVRRSPFVSLLSLFYLGLAAWNGLRLVQGIVFCPTLQEYIARPGPIYVVISGGIWLLIGSVIFWGLRHVKIWAWFAAIVTTAGYIGWYWIDRLALQKPHANWPFALGTTLILIVFSFSILLSPKTRQSFLKDTNERKSKI
jgi:hypothetical protein